MVASVTQLHFNVQFWPWRPSLQELQSRPLVPGLHVHCPDVLSHVVELLPTLLQLQYWLQAGPYKPTVHVLHSRPSKPGLQVHCPDF